MSLINDMKLLLTGIESTIFVGEMGDTPDNCLCVYATGGFPPSHSFDSKYEQPTFQVRIRNKVAATAYDKADAVKAALDGLTEQTINSVRYISIFQMGDVMPLGKDAKNRTELTVNFETKLQR
jgi:hypothetical protein